MTRQEALMARDGDAPAVNGTAPGPMVWTTAQGEQIPITQMKTSHLFNAMKMTFNHLAEIHGGQPVWFQHKYCDYTQKSKDDPERLAQMVLLMLAEIETRTDLPGAYEEPLRLIIVQIRGSRRLSEGRKQIG